jgi:hypothetical protein
MDMDRLKEIATEIIRLYRQQLNFWVLGKTSNLKDADLLQYDCRRDCLGSAGSGESSVLH